MNFIAQALRIYMYYSSMRKWKQVLVGLGLGLMSFGWVGCMDDSDSSPINRAPLPVTREVFGKEDSTLTVDIPRLLYPGSGYPPYALVLLDTAMPGVSMSFNGSELRVVPDADWHGSIALRIDVVDDSQDPYLDSLGNPIQNRLVLYFMPVDDPPRLLRSQGDTNIHFLDTLRLHLNQFFTEVDRQKLQYTVEAERGPLIHTLKDSLLLISLGDSLRPGTVHVWATDGTTGSVQLSFVLDANGPAQAGIRRLLPIAPISFAEIRPWVFLEGSERKTLALVREAGILFLDSRGRITHKAPGFKYPLRGPEGGFENRTLFFRKTASPLDSMVWLTFTDQGPKANGFAFDPGPRSRIPTSSYHPLGPQGDGPDWLFLHKKSDQNLQPIANEYSIARYSGGSISTGAPLAIPKATYLLKAMLYGDNVAVVWGRLLDTLRSSELSVGFFTKEGIALGAPRILTTYLPGSKAGFGNNHRTLLDILVFNGRLEILHSTANVLVQRNTGEIGFIDQALLRTVIDANLQVVLDSDPVKGVKPGSYGDLFPIHWEPLSASSYRLIWANLGSAGGISTGGAVVVDAVGNAYSEAVEYKPENFAARYRFADGRAFEVTGDDMGRAFGEFIPAPVDR